MTLYARNLKTGEEEKLKDLFDLTDKEIRRRASIILLSAPTSNKKVNDIAVAVGMHPINVRKWIHRFNRYGVNGLYPRRSPGRPKLFNTNQRQAVVDLLCTPPRGLGLDFRWWTLSKLRDYLIHSGVVEEISSESVRQILLANGFEFDPDIRRWQIKAQ